MFWIRFNFALSETCKVSANQKIADPWEPVPFFERPRIHQLNKPDLFRLSKGIIISAAFSQNVEKQNFSFKAFLGICVRNAAPHLNIRPTLNCAFFPHHRVPQMFWPTFACIYQNDGFGSHSAALCWAVSMKKARKKFPAPRNRFLHTRPSKREIAGSPLFFIIAYRTM